MRPNRCSEPSARTMETHGSPMGHGGEQNCPGGNTPLPSHVNGMGLGMHFPQPAQGILRSPSLRPSAAWHKSPPPPQQLGQGPRTPSLPRKGHPRAALQTLRHPKHSVGSAWEPGLPRGRRSPVPSQSSALKHGPPSQRMTPATPFPKAQPFPKGHQDLSNRPPKTTSFLFFSFFLPPSTGE